MIRKFMLEDIGFGDITTDSLIDRDLRASARVVCEESCVVAGLEESARLFSKLGCQVETLVSDGEKVKGGAEILSLSGSARAILKGERTSLNMLQRMSGIATATNRAVAKARKVNPRIRVACTRKTAPGLRYLDKRAVELGGGDTHRLNLDDCVLIKDNHLKLSSSVKDAVKKAKEGVSFTKKIEVEATSLDKAVEAAEAGADIVMLDNMRPEEISRVVEELRRRGLRDRILLEASGGITLENLTEYVETGVDVLSLGSLTHSVQAVDMNLNILGV